jgi:hypothetical protein
MNQLPVRFARHRIGIALPQIAHIVRLFQLFNRAWIMLILDVIPSNRLHILVTAMDRLNLLIPTQLLSDTRRRDAQDQQNEEDGHNQADEHEAFLLPPQRPLVGHHTHRSTT